MSLRLPPRLGGSANSVVYVGGFQRFDVADVKNGFVENETEETSTSTSGDRHTQSPHIAPDAAEIHFRTLSPSNTESICSSTLTYTATTTSQRHKHAKKEPVPCRRSPASRIQQIGDLLVWDPSSRTSYESCW